MRSWTLLLLLALAVAIPAHGTGKVVVSPATAYVPAYGPQFSSSDDILRQILDEVKGLRKDVQGLKTGTAGQQNDAATVIGNRCLSCHKDGAAQDKGGSFVLVEKDGTLAELSLAEKRRIVRMVQKGEMPPSGKIPADEIKLLADLFGPAEQKKQP